MKFPKVQSTFGITPYNPERDTDEKRRAIFEHYQSQMGAQPVPPETLPWNRPFPPGVEAQRAFDTMLQERVVDPLARAGYEGLGAGLASIPSAAHEMIVPQTEFDVAGTIIPLPGVAKAMKQGKYRKIRAAMKAEDPEKVGEIIAKQAGKTELPITQKANPAEVRSIDEKEMLRKADEANLKEQEILRKMSQNVDEEKPKKFASVDDLIKEFREFANIPQKPKIPLTSLQKGGWYDEIGGREGFEPQLENLKKLNPKAHQLHDAIDEYLKRESYRDPNIYRNDYIENAYDNIIDLIDKNLDRIKLPKPLSPGDQAIDRVLKAGQKEGKLSLPERSQLEKAMSESKKAIEAEENVEFHKERFKKIKELLGNVSTLKGKD